MLQVYDMNYSTIMGNGIVQHKRPLTQMKYGDLDGIVHDIIGGRGQSEVDTFKNVAN